MVACASGLQWMRTSLARLRDWDEVRVYFERRIGDQDPLRKWLVAGRG